MKIKTKDKIGRDFSSHLIVYAVFSELEGIPTGLPEALLADFDGKPRSFALAYLNDSARGRVALLGLGDRDDLDAEGVRRASAVAVQRARALKIPKFDIDWSPIASAGDPEPMGRAAAEGALLASYSFERFKNEEPGEGPEKRARSLKEVTFLAPDANFKRGVKRGDSCAQATAFARDLGNTPGNAMTPRQLAGEARKLASGKAQITCKVIVEADMKRLGMHAMLGVSRGSKEAARLIHLKYRPRTGKKGRRRIALVGKGLTFDSGGLSLKTARGMEDMKYDMCGGAAVLGIFHALRHIDFPHEIHGVVAASENMPDGAAQKPGDVVRAMNGKTIEVLNTDAEGRLILADALSYASARIKPDTMLDLATLTGAVIQALGHEASGVLGDRELCAELIEAGEASGERCWELPLWEAHREQVKGEVADLRNINGPSDGGGAIAGAAFLANFVGEGVRWAHLDIAGTAWGGRNREYFGGKGASGVGVRLLLEWLRARS